MNGSKNEMISRAFSAFGATPENTTLLESESDINEKCLPYIHPDITPTFRVRIGTNFLAVKSGELTRRNRYINAWDLYHSQKTNQIVKAVSVWPNNIEGTRFPSIEIQEKQMARIGHLFVAAPSKPPQTTLVDSMQKALGVLGAKQVIAYYVCDSFMSMSAPKVRSVWVIHAWGFPPFIPPTPKNFDPQLIHPDARNHLRSIIDAESGEFYGADTIPQPE